MEPEPKPSLSFPSLLRPDYLPQQNPLAGALYTQRYSNDCIMAEILELMKNNRGLVKQIAEFKESIPRFLSKWWDSSVGSADIPIMIKKVQKALVEQLQFMNAAIRQAKANKQTQDVELEQLQQEEQALLKEQNRLENELARETQKNSTNENDFNNILHDRQRLLDSLKQLQTYKIILQQENYNLSIESNKIGNAFPKDSEEEAMRKYFQQMKQVLTLLIARRKQFEQIVDQANGQLGKTKAKIERYNHESQVNQVRKDNIVKQHKELKRLKEQLAYREKCRKEAEDKKAELERNYCFQEMENVAGQYQSLQRKFDSLVGKCFALGRKMTDRVQLQPLEQHMAQQLQD